MSAAAGAGSGAGSGDVAPQTPARATADLESKEIWGERESAMEAELASLTLEQIRQRTTMMTNNVRVLTKDLRNVENQIKQQEARVKENEEKIKLNKQLPYLVANVVELLDLSPEEEEEMAAESSVTSPRMEEDKPKSKSVVIKTTQRQVNLDAAHDYAISGPPPLGATMPAGRELRYDGVNKRPVYRADVPPHRAQVRRRDCGLTALRTSGAEG